MKLLAATDTTIDTLKKAYNLVNQQNETVSSNKKTINPTDELYQQSSELIPARVISGNGLIGYTCDIYEAGLTEVPSYQGIVFLANGNSSIYSLPPGTILFVQRLNVNVMGSGGE